MARSQTRRAISFNRAVYDAIMKAASDQQSSAAEFVTDALRKLGIDIPATEHLTRAAAFLAVTNRKIAARNRANGWMVRG